MNKRKIGVLFLSLLVLLSVLLPGCSFLQEEDHGVSAAQTDYSISDQTDSSPDPDGSYTSKEEVTAYLIAYGTLPSNFITKKEAQALGWGVGDWNLRKVAPGKSIGGDRFGNYEGLLPEGHSYIECDIDYTGGRRGAKRIVYSPDVGIFYTEDHYKSFQCLYEGKLP